MLKNAAPSPDSSSTRMNSADAFATACCGIRRFMICTLVLPRAVDHAASRITPTVTVFTPPAVEPDEPPTSIRKSATAFDTSDSAFWSKVAKPAVRSVTDWNSAAISFCDGVRPPSVPGLFHSSAAKIPAPPKIRTVVMRMTSLV